MAAGQVGAGSAPDTHVVPDASRISPPVQPGIGARLSVSINLADAYTIDEIGCTLRTRIIGSDTDKSHRIEAVPGQRLDRDLVLRIRTTTHTQPSLSLLTSLDGDGQEGTFALTVLPPTLEQLPSSARDVVVVVDTSASMSGWRLTAARRAAAQAHRLAGARGPIHRAVVRRRGQRPGWGGTVSSRQQSATDFGRWSISSPDTCARKPRLLAALQAAARFLTDPGRPSILALITRRTIGNEDQIAETLPRPRVSCSRDRHRGHGQYRSASPARRGGPWRNVARRNAKTRLTISHRASGGCWGQPLLTDLNLAGDGIQLLTNSISPRPPTRYLLRQRVGHHRTVPWPSERKRHGLGNRDRRPALGVPCRRAAGQRARTDSTVGQDVPRRPPAQVSALPDRGGRQPGTADRHNVVAVRRADPANRVRRHQQRSDARAHQRPAK